MNKRAYVYVIVVDGTVRYVGKGTGRRCADHMKMVRKIARRRAAGDAVKTTHFYNRLTKAWLAGDKIEFVLLADSLSEAEAFEREKAEIAATPGLRSRLPRGDANARGKQSGLRNIVCDVQRLHSRYGTIQIIEPKWLKRSGIRNGERKRKL